MAKKSIDHTSIWRTSLTRTSHCWNKHSTYFQESPHHRMNLVHLSQPFWQCIRRWSTVSSFCKHLGQAASYTSIIPRLESIPLVLSLFSIANQQNTSTFGGTRTFHRTLKEILLLIRRDEFRSQHKDLTDRELPNGIR
jgi:hypothetical protein